MGHTRFIALGLLTLATACDAGGTQSIDVAPNAVTTPAPVAASVPAQTAPVTASGNRLVSVLIPAAGGVAAFYEAPEGRVVLCHWTVQFQPQGCSFLPKQVEPYERVH